LTAQEPAKPRDVVIIDDHPIFCMGLSRLLETQSDLQAPRSYKSRPTALEGLRTHPTDLALVDISLGEDSGLELIRELRSLYPTLPTLVVSMHDEATFARPALAAGAYGFVAKQADPEMMLAAVRAALEGRSALSPKMVAEMFSRPDPARLRADPTLRDLSDRELEVLELVGWGRSVKEIGVLLDVAPKTVETLRRRIRDKTGLQALQDLTRFARAWVERAFGRQL